ncbi:VOC family protein [Williamwhitmania taraxaci]|uniref:Catechol 2,3-dioxygenase n=1 Tax=Williamwhitmania taraxaci TaxID=1640674 RepID=A0A1G6QRU2_9BACT|nr:VOC family protein [Williamwhitmania taraxaci]SDC95070.1 Catechol 2,3-dioxygenase [Williamwhitmania taraxaci]
MAIKIHHIALKVSDTEKAAQMLYGKGGFKADETTYFAEVGMKIGFVNYRGTLMELLQPVDIDCPIINDKDGLHHIAFEMENLDEFHAQLQNIPIFQEIQDIRRGREGRIFFFRMKAKPFVWYECMEKPKSNE